MLKTYDGILKIDQKRKLKPTGKLMVSDASFSERWADAEAHGYKAYRGKKRWRVEHTYLKPPEPGVRRSAIMRELPVTTIIKQGKLQKHMTFGEIKRAALPYVIAHEIKLRIRDGKKEKYTEFDRAEASKALSEFFKAQLDKAFYEHFVHGKPISVRSDQDGAHAKGPVPLHDSDRGRMVPSVDGETLSGQDDYRRPVVLSNLFDDGESGRDR